MNSLLNLVREDEDEEEACGADQAGEHEPEARALEGRVEARDRDGKAHDGFARELRAVEHLCSCSLRPADRGAHMVGAVACPFDLRARAVSANGGRAGIVDDAARDAEDGEAHAVVAAAVAELADAAEVARGDRGAEGVGGEQRARAHVALCPAAYCGAERRQL